MTDSRVTPQAVAAVQQMLRETQWMISTPIVEQILTAAAPLLCQPLQDEIDRLRAAVDEVRDMHVASACTCENCDGEGMCCVAGCWGHWPCLTAEALDALAAVPVGTGNEDDVADFIPDYPEASA